MYDTDEENIVIEDDCWDVWGKEVSATSMLAFLRKLDSSNAVEKSYMGMVYIFAICIYLF